MIRQAHDEGDKAKLQQKVLSEDHSAVNRKHRPLAQGVSEDFDFMEYLANGNIHLLVAAAGTDMPMRKSEKNLIDYDVKMADDTLSLATIVIVTWTSLQNFFVYPVHRSC